MHIPIKYNIRSLLERKSRTALSVLGVAAVIAIFVAMTAFAEGMSANFENTGSVDNLVVLQKGAFNQSLSSIPRSSNDVIRFYSGIQRDGDTILASPELAVEPWVTVPTVPDEVFVVARGIEPVFFRVVDFFRLIDGNAALRGNRVLLGPAIRHKLGGIGIGDTFTMYQETWTVAGLFEANGSSLEFSILADLGDLMRAANRDEYSSYTLKLSDAREVDTIVKRLEDDRRILVTAMPERAYYAASGMVFSVVSSLGVILAMIVSLGAVFGGLNTMYTTVAGRTREIGTLRALGFNSRSILVSFVLEALLIATFGGALGVAAGLLVNGARISVMVASIKFTVTPAIAAYGMGLSTLIGLIGGFPPARHASKLSVVHALKYI